MRISDWSSDVCSSDLGHLLQGYGLAGQQRCRQRCGALGLDPDHAYVGAQRLDRHRHPRDQSATPGGDQHGAYVRDLLEDLEAGRTLPGDDVLVVERVDQHGEIGRAWGRERGWQYVEFPGVAVTLKKKKRR